MNHVAALATPMRLKPLLKQAEDEALAVAAVEDYAAFAELYRRHAERIYRYVYVRVNHVQDAEDLTTQTFMAAMKSIHRYRQQGTFAAWITSIARHKVMDHYRARRDITTLDDAHTLLHPGISPELATSQRLRLEAVQVAMMQLNENRAEVIVLRIFSELSSAETATIMGKSVSAIDVLLHRALNQLRTILKETDDER